MSQEALKTGVGSKIAIGLMAAVLFVVGFFGSLLALAVAGALGLFTVARVWWARRRTDKACIDAEYHVIRD
jgi:hypothetical protein